MKKLLAVLGKPIGHSLSPIMHNNECMELNLPYHYLAFEVEENDLCSAIDGLRSLKCRGFNVTIPYKEKVIPFLDDIDYEAKAIGAVNTVVNEEGKLVGYNTDGRGFIAALQNKCGDWKQKRILVIGAGGAARAIYISLVRNGATVVDIANRNIDKASMLKNDAEAKNTTIRTIEEVSSHLHLYDIIINTTPVGMEFNGEIPITLDNVRKSTLLSDIIYTPMQTTWLMQGEQKGLPIMNGLEMFVQQGALAFEYWTGINPNQERMKQVVLHQLKERNKNANR
jgi:shikimate dehydrogenase